MEDALRVIHALEVVIDFRAERSAREWMIGIACQRQCRAVANFDDPAARVRAIVPARTTNDLDCLVR
jgi:hypothetical protein